MIYKLYTLPIIGKILQKFITKYQGGEKESITLRNLFKKKYKVNIGLYTYGSCFSPKFNIGGTVNIGRYCSFGHNICYLGANHPVKHAVMSAYFYNKSFGNFNVNDVKRETLTIGNDVWVGKDAIIVSSCHSIGNGAVIAAGSVVTKDVPPYAIVGGVPARIIKYRFSDEIIALLEKSQWWTFSPHELMKFYDYIDNPKIWSEKILEYKAE